MPTVLEFEPATAVLITVLHRAGGGQWRKVGVARTWAAAVRLVDTGGDWWLRVGPEEPGEEDPGLFDDVEAAAECSPTPADNIAAPPALTVPQLEQTATATERAS